MLLAARVRGECAAVAALVLLSFCANCWSQPAALSRELWAEKIHAAWVGKVAAGSGALPTEMMPREHIAAKFGVINGPVQKPTSRGPLDDTTLAFLGWQAAREYGADFTTADVAREWVSHITDPDLKGGGFGQEFLDGLKRLRRGEAPPIRSGTPREEWISAQMRAEVWGLLAPGNATLAAEWARRDAELLNSGNAIYAAQFVAAITSRLMVDPDIAAAIDVARTVIPGDCVLSKVIADTIAWHQAQPIDWGATWDAFVEKWRDRSLEAQFAAWDPDWLVETGGWPEAEVLASWQGERNVLRTHPFTATEPARLTTELDVPADGGTLAIRANCNDMPSSVDWLLRVRIAEMAREETIRWVNGGPQWQDFTFDLKPWAGRHIAIILENAVAGKFAWDAGFWTPPQIRNAAGEPIHGSKPTGGRYRYPVDFTPRILRETFCVLTGLLYGDGDFRKSVSIATMCGFDTDCNAGTVGCLLGARNGLDAIPAEWRDPINDTYELQVTGLPRQWKIADLAREMAQTGADLAAGKTPTGPVPPAATPVPAPVTQVPVAQDKPEGFGAVTRGGEGGRIITVTTLADSGPGSFREALAAKGPRIILFGVEGTITLQSRLRCTNGQVTIDGGSAPGQGITLLNHGIQFRGDCDDIIVRNLRIRVTTGGAEGDCLLLWGLDGGTVERVLVDHCSFMWATDEVINTWGNVRDVTFQWCIMAEARLPHTKGWLSGVGSDRITIHHCLFAQNGDRVPKLEGGVYDVVNNLIYNWGVNNAAKIESGAKVNLVNNWFLPGADSKPTDGCIFPQNPELGTQLYLSGNVGPYTPTGAEDQWLNVNYFEQAGGRWVAKRPAPDVFRAATAFAAPTVTLQTPAEAADAILARAGAVVRDADDVRVIEAVRDRSGRVGCGH